MSTMTGVIICVALLLFIWLLIFLERKMIIASKVKTISYDLYMETSGKLDYIHSIDIVRMCQYSYWLAYNRYSVIIIDNTVRIDAESGVDILPMINIEYNRLKKGYK